MTRIYSDIEGEVLTTELETKLVYIYDECLGSPRKNPKLILPNKLAVEKLRDYLNDVLEVHYK